MTDLLKNITFLDDSNWVEFIQQDKITLLNFLAGAHLGCRHQIPVIRSFAERYGDIYNVAVVDASKNREACLGCQIDGIPNMVILRQGIVLGGRRGGLSCDDEAEFIERLAFLQQMDMTNALNSQV